MDSPASRLDTAFPGLRSFPVIGIARRLPSDVVAEAAGAAFDSGLRFLEITMDSDGAIDVIAALRRRHTGIGVGSVTTVDQVTRARDAGAEFVVTPITRPDVIVAATDHGMAVVPGAATPTEIDLALASGAVAVKVFPAEQLGGPGYLRAIRSPLGEPPLVPTGGVTPSNAAEYLRAGAVAVGAGSALFSADCIAAEGVGWVARRTAQWLEALA